MYSGALHTKQRLAVKASAMYKETRACYAMGRKRGANPSGRETPCGGVVRGSTSERVQSSDVVQLGDAGGGPPKAGHRDDRIETVGFLAEAPTTQKEHHDGPHRG